MPKSTSTPSNRIIYSAGASTYHFLLGKMNQSNCAGHLYAIIEPGPSQNQKRPDGRFSSENQLDFLFSLYLLSGVPSALVWTVAGGALAASLFDLYLMSAVPSFLVGPATVDVVFADALAAPALVLFAAVPAVLAFVVFAALLVALALVPFLGSFGLSVCALVNPAKKINRLPIRIILFIKEKF